MWKKIALLVVVAVFIIGASGGCLSGEKPNLSGDWEGQLQSTLFSNFTDTSISIIDLQQDQSGNLTGGDVCVKYSPNSNPITFPVTPVSSGSKTDEWQATIIAEGTADQDIMLGSTTISNGTTYRFEFLLPHAYGCRGGSLNELSGGYTLRLQDQTLDTGTVTITRQAP